MTTFHHWLTLRSIKGLNDESLWRLVQIFGSPEGVFNASIQSLQEKGKIRDTVANAIHEGPDAQAMAHIHQEFRQLEEGKFSIMSILDTEYPSRLKTIPVPPPYFTQPGNWKLKMRMLSPLWGQEERQQPERLLQKS